MNDENGVVVRPLTASDAARNRQLMNHAFGSGRIAVPPAEGADVVAGYDPVPKVTLGAFAGGGDDLRASLTICAFDIHWRGARDGVLPMGGIASVATWAEARGRGYVDALLRESLRTMREAGQVVSALYPFAWNFYKRYGWDFVGDKREVTLPLTQLKTAPEGRNVRDLTDYGHALNARAAITPAYTQFAQNYRGAFTEKSHRWDRALEHSGDHATHIYGYFPDTESDTCAAYLLWRFDTEGDGALVREFAAQTPGDYRALLSLLHYLATQKRIARVTLPADTPLWSHLMHWDLKTQTAPVFAGRIVDVAAAFARLSAAQEGENKGASSVTVDVRDEHAPWNNGVWRIAAEGGNMVCEKETRAAEGDVTLSIAALSQAFWGTPSLADLRRAGLVEVQNEAGFAVLLRLLPPAPVFTLDHF